MNFLNKDVLLNAAALGGGVVVSKIVKKQIGSKIAEKLPATMGQETKDVLLNLLPIAGGFATLMVGGNNSIAKGLANGMFADAFAGIVDFALLKTGVTKEPITGTGDVFMGDVFMGQSGSSDVLMGAAEDMPAYASDSFDFTASDAGEINY